MAAGNATTAANNADRPPSPHLDSTPVVNLRRLSQSELYSLSLSSDDINRSDDVVIPKINRSVFNESAGSRKQTYSRLRLAPPESSSTIHRRTPHLRSLQTTPFSNINDPEQAENSEIIRVLKQLLKSDPNFQDIASIEDENNNFVVPELLNHTLPLKRKRGRPRKHENAIFLRPPAAKRLRNNMIKKAVVYDNEKDREMVNDRGVTVNLTTLAGLEDPYGPEIRRRTVGMSTEDELLGFLRGLNGQWGSRRKKRRLVDASEFGDALPKGWKLILSIKKREGRVWLFCRRYISPSGRQFQYCKEISTYLVSVIGEENLDKPNHTNVNSHDDFTSKGASMNAADLVLQEDIQKDGPFHNPSPPLPSPPTPSSPTNSEKEVMNNEIKKTEPSLAPTVESDSNPKSQSPVLAEDNVALETYDAHSSDKLMATSPRSNDKIISGTENAELIPDRNILSDTKEDRQMDGNENLLSEESCDKSGKDCIIVEESSGGPQVNCVDNELDSNLDLEKSSGSDLLSPFGSEQMGSPSCVGKDEISMHVSVAVSPSELLGDEVSMPVDESNEKLETTCVDDKPVCNQDQGISTECVLLSAHPNEQMGSVSGVGEDEISIHPSNEVLIQDAVSKTECVLEKGSSGIHPNELIGKDDNDEVLDHAVSSAKKDMHITSMSDQLISEENKVVPSGFFLSRFGLDKDSAIEVKNLSTNENHPLLAQSINPVKAINSASLLSSHTQESPQKESFGYNNVDGRFDSYGASRMSTYANENKFTTHSSLSSWPEEECEKSSLLGDGRSHCVENNVEKAASSSSKEMKLDDFQFFRNNEPKHKEPVDSLGSGQNLEFGFQDDFSIAENSDDIFENKMYSTPLDGLKFEEDRDMISHELSLAFGNPHAPSKIDEAFDVHTSLSMVNNNNNNMVEDLNETSGFRNGANLVYPGSASHGFTSSSNKKLTTGFGSNHARPHEDLSSGMWKTSQGNQLQSNLAAQSPTSFHSFDIMSQKVEDRHFRLHEQYNDGFGVSGLRAGRSEPMEFSFLTGQSEQNPNAIQGGGTRVFTYNPEFESSFWLGKNAMNQATSVCAWCRNEFHLQPINSQTQDGIGSLCPACSAGISGL